MRYTWNIDSACDEVNIYSLGFDTEATLDYVMINDVKYDGRFDGWFDDDKVDQLVPGNFTVYFHSDSFHPNYNKYNTYRRKYKELKLYWRCTTMVVGECYGLGHWSSYFAGNWWNGLNPANGDIEFLSSGDGSGDGFGDGSGDGSGDDQFLPCDPMANVIAAEARHTLSGPNAGSNLKLQNLTLTTDGLTCNDADQSDGELCNDYEVKYCCQSKFCQSQF